MIIKKERQAGYMECSDLRNRKPEGRGANSYMENQLIRKKGELCRA